MISAYYTIYLLRERVALAQVQGHANCLCQPREAIQPASPKRHLSKATAGYQKSSAESTAERHLDKVK